MIIEPYKLRPAPPRIALLVNDRQALDEDEGLQPLWRLEKGVQVWSSQERVLALLRAGKGKAICWRGQPIRYAPPVGDGYLVRVLGLELPLDDQKALLGLLAWRDWLTSEGAAPMGSLGSSAMSLLRAKLERILWCTAPHAQAPPIRWTIGARQQLGPAGAPATYRGALRLFDMRAAYAQTLAQLNYGGHWHRMRVDGERSLYRLRLFAAEHPLFCRARVRLSGDFPGPLVRRSRGIPDPTGLAADAPYPRTGTLQGVWTYQELLAAEETGAKATILDAWGHASACWQPFLPWWRTIEQGREGLAGFGSTLAKATGNALWGQFCVQPGGRRSLLYFDKRGVRRVELLDSRTGPRPAHDLSELLTGLVRARLQRFMVAAGSRLCSAHTDGGWVDCSDGWAYDDPDWRLKRSAVELRVLDPQKLAYREPHARKQSYVVAGWPAALAKEQFERQWEETCLRSNRTAATAA